MKASFIMTEFLPAFIFLAICNFVNGTSCPAVFTQERHVLRNHVIASSLVKSISDCQQQCASHTKCHSINFYANQRCELNNATHLSNPMDLSYEAQGTYMIHGNRPMSVCSDSLCSSRHICLMNNNEDENNKGNYICRECSPVALGMESRTIPNSAITASSMWGSGHEPWRARLNNKPAMPYDYSIDSASWASRNEQVGEFLQVDLGRVTYVTMVATQGRPFFSNQYVTEYSLAYKQGESWIYYQEGIAVKKFVGNNDTDTPVFNQLREKIPAQYIRLVALQWHGFIAMRVELYGCF